MMALKKPTDVMSLSYLLEGFADVTAVNDRFIGKIEIDSRKIEAGDVFLACKGQLRDGAQFIDAAIAAGASAVVVDKDLFCENKITSVPIIVIDKLNAKIGLIADRFYQQPSSSMNVIGITGTNGKTSTAHFIAQVLSAQETEKSAVIGTLGIGTPDNMHTGLNTTPDALTIHRALNSMRNEHVKNVVMEVSSHALEQSRVSGVNFDIGVFTNLSHEHLDYHLDMESYGEAKRQLFLIESLRHAVINADDEFGQRLLNELEGRLQLVSYGLEKNAVSQLSKKHLHGTICDSSIANLSIQISSPWGEGKLKTKLTGAFNAGNLLASLSVLCLSGMKFEKALQGLSAVEAVPGRMECFGSNDQVRVIVDYAHTPDALQKALTSLQQIKKGKLICVFGCGGDRDQGKRPLMGRVAESYADQIVLTSDNPRTENPDVIIRQILAGIESKKSITIIPDRTTAIASTIDSADVDDVILIAGKGHETYQEVDGIRSPFSDRQLVRNLLESTE